MKVMMDASAAVELVLNRIRAKEIEKILGRADAVLAPDIYIFEINNIFWKYTSFYNLDYEYCLESLDTAMLLIDVLYEAKDLVNEAFAESYRQEYPVYDLMYAVLAGRTGALLLTIGGRLKELCNDMGIRTR